MPKLGSRTTTPSRLAPAVLVASALALSLVSAPSTAQPVPAEGATARTATSVRTTETTLARRRTDVGSTVYERDGESTREAFLRVRNTYGGRLGAVRVFFPGLPAPWSRIRDTYGRTPLVVSFKADPAAVAAGRYDRELRSWFRHAPEQRLTRWSFWHEPEDDAERGHLSLRAYRQAWRHLDDLADSVGNPKLRATLILMCWTMDPLSRRHWRDYYAGPGTINVFAFDCYNAGQRNDTYRSPREMLRRQAALARRTGKTWGIAELGSVLVDGDNGSGRADWLRRSVRFAREHDARFVTYFDSYVSSFYDYRLHDTPSRNAWKRLVSNQFG